MLKKLRKDERNLLILIVLALIVVGIYFSINAYSNYKKKKEDTKKEEIKYIFSNFKKDNINLIQINGLKNHYKLTLKKQNGHWKFIEPKGLRADDNSVEAYLTTMRYLTWIEKVAKKDIDDSLFGFDNPELSIHFAGKEGDANVSFDVIIGGKSPIGDRYYIRKNNEKTIYIIDGLTHDSMVAKIDNMRSKKIFTEVPRQEIGYIEFHNYIDNIHNTFYYFNNNWIWKFKNIEKVYKANSLPVKTLLDRISEFGVDKFLPGTPKYNKPDYKIIIKSMDGKKYAEFDLIESDENLPQVEKKFTIINKKTNESYQATLSKLYTYFTEKPYKFFQEAK